MCGGRAVVELMYADFIGCAGDEIFNQMAKWQAMSAGILKMPVILRVSVGSKYGAQHSPGLDGPYGAYSRPEGCLPGDSVRCEGPDECSAERNRSGRLLRVASAFMTREKQFHKEGVPTGLL